METIEPWISHLGRVSPLHDGARALRSPADEHAASVPALLVCAGAPGTLYPPPLAAPVQCAHAPHVLREKQQPTSVNVNSKRFKLKGGGGKLNLFSNACFKFNTQQNRMASTIKQKYVLIFY